MKLLYKSICLLAVGLSCLVCNAHAFGTGMLILVKPVMPPAAVDAVVDNNNKPICTNGLVLQSNGQCCPTGTSNDLLPDVCTPPEVIKDQIYHGRGGTQYCPSADLYIVGDKNGWFSCATSDSTPLYLTPLYPDAKKSEGLDFCLGHGYGFLIKIKPWGTAGCIKTEESGGDGCIEAGTCSFVKGK